MGLLLAAGHLSAQTFQLGIKAGGNLESFTGSDGPNYTSHSFQAGWNAGIFTNFWLGNHFAIAPEVLYTTAGAQIKTTNSDNNQNVYVNNQLNLSYISVPVMAKFRFTGGFYLETGPEINFNISQGKYQNETVKTFTNSSEFAWGLGLGYQSPIGLGIGARYNVGLSRVDNVDQTSFNDVNWRNSGFQLDLFWTLFGNHKDSEHKDSDSEK